MYIKKSGRYSKVQTENILAGIENSVESQKMLYVISEPEVSNA